MYIRNLLKLGKEEEEVGSVGGGRDNELTKLTEHLHRKLICTNTHLHNSYSYTAIAIVIFAVKEYIIIYIYFELLRLANKSVLH